MTPFPPQTWAPDTQPTEAELIPWLRSLDDEQFAAWLRNKREWAEVGWQCAMRKHEEQIEHLLNSAYGAQLG